MASQSTVDQLIIALVLRNIWHFDHCQLSTVTREIFP